jgi:protocatechuate 3,4-dioxygenase beta subunit
LGPFHTHEAQDMNHGDLVHRDPDGEPCLIVCSVKDTAGNPITAVKIDTWETDSHGRYDVQYEDHDGPNGRAVLYSDEKGAFWFKAIVPTPYPVPSDGPVGVLLRILNRHPMRPSHIHFMFTKPGYDHLIT